MVVEERKKSYGLGLTSIGGGRSKEGWGADKSVPRDGWPL